MARRRLIDIAAFLAAWTRNYTFIHWIWMAFRRKPAKPDFRL